MRGYAWGMRGYAWVGAGERKPYAYSTPRPLDARGFFIKKAKFLGRLGFPRRLQDALEST